jgi:hypothetical protein
MAEEDKVPVGDNYICNKCSGFLGHTLNENGNRGDHACCVCLGLWEDHAASIQQAIDKACEPYGGVETNRFSTDEAPSVAIPGDIALRYHLAFSLEGSRAATELADFLRHLKSHVKNVALDYVMSRQATSLEGYPPCVKREEQGYLCVHILLTPSSEVNRPSNVVLSVNKKHRKRFRGNELNDKQGGDPRRNLESRLRKQGVDVWPCVDVETLLAGSVPPDTLKAWSGWFRTSATAPRLSVQYNVAVWRKPFFLRGLYTKARRDVSQTPFYVPSDKDASIMQRLGVTSVEEQILPVLTNVACGGISTLNADPNRDDLVFSMVKFHASGREDLDVRMLLPPDSIEDVGGRPFICQVVDALCMPTMDQVLQVPQKINCTDSENSNACDDNDELAGRRYGRNPLGVDISDSFTFVPSIAFKNLQSDTEEKVKYYGCLCWSGRAISSQEELETRLGTFPLELNQKTPIRVLHRRSRSTRVRRVLSLRATLIDAHHFRLNLSTDAGTYVKEFAHGDLGRTVPSVSSLLECKVDMLELDCEGIAGVYFCPS